MADWKEPDPNASDHKLIKSKMRCGCYTYYQRGTAMGIYTLLVNDSCREDHELAVGPNTTPPGTEPHITLEVSTEMRETQLEAVPAPKLNLS